MAEESKADIALSITNNINSDGNPSLTRATMVRTVLGELNDSNLNIVDCGNVLQNLTGYTSELTPSDNKHLVPKKYVDDKRTASEFLENKTIDLANNTLIGTASQFNASLPSNFFSFANPRVYSINYEPNVSVNLDLFDCYEQTTMTGNTTIDPPLGGLGNFRKTGFRFTSASSHTITWDPTYSSGIIPLPTTTVAGKSLSVVVEYNSTKNVFECIYVTTVGGGGSGTVNSGNANEIAYYSSTGAAVSGTSTLPNSIQNNITRTGTLTSGATGSGFTVALSASTISGVLPSANGGAGTINGLIKANGSGIVSQSVAGTDYTTPTGTENLTNKSIGAGCTYTGSSISSANTEAKIKGSVGGSTGVIPYGSGVADTVTTNSTFVSDGTKMSIGAVLSGGYNGTVLGQYNSRVGGSISRSFMTEDSGSSSGVVAIEVRGYSASSGTRTTYQLASFGSAVAGNYPGTSIALSKSFAHFYEEANYPNGLADDGTGKSVSVSANHIFLIGQTGTNNGLLIGSSGIRIDDISNLHTAAIARLSIGAATANRSSINLASGVDPSSPINGDIWFDGIDLKIRVSGVTRTFVLI
jgi:hypothetical protein